jgi:CBS domain-containing protein
VTLAEVMHVHIPTLDADSTIRDAVDKMDIYQFPALIVVGQEREPLAVITEGDLARAAIAKGDITGLTNAKALEFATKEPQTASPDLEVSEALHRMLSQGLTILPIVSANRLLGVALRVDLMQALLMDVASPLSPD